MHRTLRLLACLAIGLGFTLGVSTMAQATQGTDHKGWVCHPVEGGGETGYGWNYINPDKASSHIDEQGNGKHTRKDGSTDVWADEAGNCPGYVPTPTPTPSDTVTPSPTPSETVTPTPTPSETVTPTPTPSETVTPTPTPSETVTPTPTPSESTPTPTPSESTPTPTPSESTPTPTPSETDTPTPTATSTTTPSPSDTPAPTTDTPTQPPTMLAQTGSSTGNMLVWAVGLIMAGMLALLASRKPTAQEVHKRQH